MLMTSLIKAGGSSSQLKLDMEMKKSILLLTGAALLLAGCAKVENEAVVPEPTMKHVVLKASVNEADTRVSADAAGSFSWQAGDEIAVYTDQGTVAKLTASNGGSTADFEGDLPSDAGFGSYAFYPYADNFCAPSADDHIVFTLGGEHNFVQDATNMPMMGAITDEGVTFEAVGGVLKLIVYNVPQGANEFRFVSTGGKKIAGNFTVTNGAIVTEDAIGAVEDTQKFLFERPESGNMVFYIPLPTGTIGAFKVQFYGEDKNTPVYEKTANANLIVGKNKLIVAPALNTTPVIDDAMLTNSEIVNSDLTKSYPTQQSSVVKISNTYGDWYVSGLKGGNYSGSGNYFVQIRKAGTSDYVSYIQLPTFENNIATVVLQGVVNIQEQQFTGTAYFRSVASNSGSVLASGTATEAFGDIVLSIPSGHKTGYIMTSNPLLISSIKVTFSSGSTVIPTISVGSEECTINAGNLNASINNVILNHPLDGTGIATSFSADWIASAIVNEENRLIVTAANYNHTEAARSAEIKLLATGASKTVTVKQNPSIVPNPSNLTAETGNATFTATWTGDNKAKSYVGFYGTTELSDPTTGVSLTISNEGNNYTGVPSGAVENGTTYYVYVKVNEVADASAGKYAASPVWATTTVKPVDPSSGHVFTASELSAGDNTAQITVNQLLGYRLGTSSNDGSVTIPAGYSTITFYGVGWKSKAKTLLLDNATFATGSPTSLTANEDATGTINDGDPVSIEGGDLFTISVTDTTKPVVISGHRSILWNFIGKQ